MNSGLRSAISSTTIAATTAEATSQLQHMLHARAYPDDHKSLPSSMASILVAGDTVAPSAPTIAASAVVEGIKLTITRPTTNADGTTCYDLRWLVIYYSASDSIDTSDSDTYDGTVTIAPATQWTDDVDSGTTRYYVVTAQDRTGNEGVASNEVSATAAEGGFEVDIPDDATGLVFDGDPKVGDAMLGIVLKTPDSSWVGFSHWVLEYAVSTDSGSSWGEWQTLVSTKSFGYAHKGRTTSAGYRYKYRGRPLGTDDTPDVGDVTWDESDNSGNGWPDSGTWGADNSALTTEFVFTEVLVATNEVRTDHLKANAITGEKISSATTITAGSGDDVGVLDGADSTYRIYAGDATPGDAPFRVSKAGVLYATGATISGAVTITSGSGIGNLSDAGDLAALDDITLAKVTDAGDLAALDEVGASDCDATIISDDKIITGLLTATNIQTGTLNCSLITVSNLSASSITTGTLSASRISGGTIGSCTINANYITTGTITARTYQTASSGARSIVKPSSGLFGQSHSFEVWNASTQWVTVVGPGMVRVGPGNTTRGALYSSVGTGTLYLRDGSNHELTMTAAATASGKSSTSTYLPLVVNGYTRYVLLYS